MVALVSVETVLLVLLVILVAGLLRSHGAIMRRLGPRTPATRPRTRGPCRSHRSRAALRG